MATLDTQARMAGPTTFEVEVSGSWFDPRTSLEVSRTERFRILAPHPAAAETAAVQCYASAAAAARCTAVGRRFVKTG